MAQNWKYLSASKKSSQQASIPKEWILTDPPSSNELNVLNFPETCGLLTAKEVEITNTHVEVLLKKLANAEWSSVAVTTAFAKRAIIAHQLTNCLTEVFIERALAHAAELDAHLQASGKFGIGLPVSLKDQVNIKGIESTVGYASWVGQYAERNAVVVDVLEALGAVLYVKTNIPQTLMWPETYNLVFGRTTNPNNRGLTCGGSSGGEGALIGRVPYAGSINTLDGLETIPSILGPLSNSIHGIKVFIQGILSQKSWLRDPLVISKGWSEEQYNLSEYGGGKKLCFAVMWNDGLFVPHPPIIRGLETAKNALIKAGHKGN
ncbi:hypothetical protein C0992_008210 [Termitomyces sp. T32_za158]|nr:hypothetical protein C0992_008210 [Termitomyces sp. T32_za158]